MDGKKSILLLLFSVLAFSFFLPQVNKRQENFWPVVKGKWYFNKIVDTSIVYLTRTNHGKSTLNYISKDTCEMRIVSSDDSYVSRQFRWEIKNDILLVYKKNDTTRVKVLKYSSDELVFKRIY